MASGTLPNHLAYATSVSGWPDMYVRRNPAFSATGSNPGSLGMTVKIVIVDEDWMIFGSYII